MASMEEDQQMPMDPQVASIIRSLTPEEIDMLRDAFIYMDKDSDGFLSQNELMQKVYEAVGAERFEPLQEYLLPLFDVADKDKDEKLSLIEFLISFADGPGVVPGEVINSCVASIRVRLTDEEISALQESFKRIDTNDDGYIDKDELFLALKQDLSEKNPTLTDSSFREIVSMVMASADSDQDGRLCLSEFIRSFQEDQGVLPAAFVDARVRQVARQLSDDELAVLKEAFSVLDKNQDGYVDFIDLYNALWETLSSGVRDANQIRELCDLIMVTADRKQNGKLNLNDFVRGFLQNMNRMTIAVSVAQDQIKRGCEQLQRMHDSGELGTLVVSNDQEASGNDFLDRSILIRVLMNLFKEAFNDWDEETIASVMAAIVVGADTDENGQLTLEEFIRSFAEGPGVVVPSSATPKEANSLINSAGEPFTYNTNDNVNRENDPEWAKDLTNEDIASISQVLPALFHAADPQSHSVSTEIINHLIMEQYGCPLSKAKNLAQYICANYTTEACIPEGGIVHLLPRDKLSATIGSASPESLSNTNVNINDSASKNKDSADVTGSAQQKSTYPPVPIPRPAAHTSRSLTTYNTSLSNNQNSRALNLTKDKNSYAYNTTNHAIFDDDLRTEFINFDVDKKGYLDRDEFKKQYARMEQFGAPVTPADVDRVFNRYCRDSKKLFYDEFCIIMLQRAKM